MPGVFAGRVHRLHLGLHRTRRAAGVRLQPHRVRPDFRWPQGARQKPDPLRADRRPVSRGGRSFSACRKFVMGRSPLGHRAASEGPAPTRCASTAGNPRPAPRCFSACSRWPPSRTSGWCCFRSPGAGMAPSIPDEFTLHHYIEALGNGLVVPSIQNSLLYAGCATLRGAGHRPRRGLGRRALGPENPRLAGCRGHAAARRARTGDGVRLSSAFAGGKTVPFSRRRGRQSVHAARHRLRHPPAAVCR